MKKKNFQVPDAFQGLIDNIYETLKTTIENEEGVPIHHVTNMDEVLLLIEPVFDCQSLKGFNPD